MNAIQRLIKNTAAHAFANFAMILLYFFSMMYAIRYLGADSFGVLSFALAITAIFNVVIDMGLNKLMTREVARDRSLATKYIGNMISLKLVLSLVMFSLIALTVNLLNYPEQTTLVVYVIALSGILNSFNRMFYAVYYAHERMEVVAFGQLLDGLFRLGGVVFIINQSLDLIAIAYLYLSISALVLTYNILMSLWKFARIKIEFDTHFWTKMLRQAWPFALVVASVGIYYWIDSVMLSVMDSNEVVGWYGAAYRLVLALAFIPNAYFVSIYPIMSKLYLTARKEMSFTFQKSLKYMLILAVPIGIGVTLLANRIIPLFFGSGYAASITTLRILIWSLVFLFINGVFAHIFYASNKQIIRAKVAGICALLNIFLNVVLIPGYSYIGASIATVITEFIALALVFYYGSKLRYSIDVKKFLHTVLKVFMASAIMGTFVYYFNDMSLWALLPLSILIYVIVLYMIKGIDKGDVNLLRKLLRSDK